MSYQFKLYPSTGCLIYSYTYVNMKILKMGFNYTLSNKEHLA